MRAVRQHSRPAPTAQAASRFRVDKARLNASAVGLVLVVSAPSCTPAAGDDVLRAIRPVADDVDTLQGSR